MHKQRSNLHDSSKLLICVTYKFGHAKSCKSHYSARTKWMYNMIQAVFFCHAVAMLPSCCQAVAMLLPCCCQAVAKLLPNCCHAIRARIATNLLCRRRWEANGIAKHTGCQTTLIGSAEQKQVCLASGKGCMGTSSHPIALACGRKRARWREKALPAPDATSTGVTVH